MSGEHRHTGDHHRSSDATHSEHRFPSDDDTPSPDPYPLVYSKDPWDERRWNRTSSQGPSVYRVGRAGVLFSWAIIAGVAVLLVLAILAQASAGH